MSLPQERFRALVAPEALPLVNIGAGKDLTIRELAEVVAKVVGYGGNLVFDRSKPDGTPRKLLDVSKLERLGWTSRIALRQGIESAYQHFLDGVRSVRAPASL
jgi:GDP-L-fucose synthase